MINIDEYIEKSKDIKNTSDGGSASFIFNDKVLVRYETKSKYGIPRECEEEIMINVNKLVDKGVNTPRHLAYKRETIGDTAYCWVLQEKAPGVCYEKYCRINDPTEQLKKQKEVVEIPNEHYEKYIADLIELFYFGLEPKPKNFFYDKEKGFTTIDLLKSGSEKKFDNSSLKDILFLFRLTNSITNCSIPFYNKTATDEMKKLSTNMNYLIQFKIFNAVKNTIPNFDKYERFILRTYDSETLEQFRNFGLQINDLSLNVEEENTFNEIIHKIVQESVEKIKSGKYKLWQIKINEIRNELSSYGLKKSWMYHKNNIRKQYEKPENWDDNEAYTFYDYKMECEKDLEHICFNIFVNLLKEESYESNNEYINQAIEELQEEKKKQK